MQKIEQKKKGDVCLDVQKRNYVFFLKIKPTKCL